MILSPGGRPDPFRTVRDLGRVAACCSCQSGEPEGRSSAWLAAWLPVARHGWHLSALVLVIASGLSSVAETVISPTQTPPPNPTAAEPDGKRVLARVGVADHEVTLKAPLPGSGWRETVLRRVRGRTPTFHPHSDRRQANRANPHHQLGKSVEPPAEPPASASALPVTSAHAALAASSVAV